MFLGDYCIMVNGDCRFVVCLLKLTGDQFLLCQGDAVPLSVCRNDVIRDCEVTIAVAE